jgi:hypothetical protein
LCKWVCNTTLFLRKPQEKPGKVRISQEKVGKRWPPARKRVEKKGKLWGFYGKPRYIK